MIVALALDVHGAGGDRPDGDDVEATEVVGLVACGYLRGCELPVELTLSEAPARLKVSTTTQHGLTGWRAGLAAGPKSEMPAMLRAMAETAGVPVSKLGGPWALGAEANRGSYLFADLSFAAVDDWIELARRGGFSTIHIHGWWDTLGHYGVNRGLFPNGLADLKETVARIQHNIQKNPNGWSLSGLRDPGKAVQNDGGNVLPVMMIEACSTKYSAPILKTDDRRYLSKNGPRGHGSRSRERPHLIGECNILPIFARDFLAR